MACRSGEPHCRSDVDHHCITNYQQDNGRLLHLYTCATARPLGIIARRRRIGKDSNRTNADGYFRWRCFAGTTSSSMYKNLTKALPTYILSLFAIFRLVLSSSYHSIHHEERPCISGRGSAAGDCLPSSVGGSPEETDQFPNSTSAQILYQKRQLWKVRMKLVLGRIVLSTDVEAMALAQCSTRRINSSTSAPTVATSSDRQVAATSEDNVQG